MINKIKSWFKSWFKASNIEEQRNDALSLLTHIRGLLKNMEVPDNIKSQRAIIATQLFILEAKIACIGCKRGK